MDIVKKIIYFAVGIIMTVGFIVIGMSMYNKSKNTISSANAQYDDLMGRYADIAYALYDGTDSSASGAELKELIAKLTDESVTVYVKNGAFLKGTSGNEDGVAYNCSEGNSCGYGSGNSSRVDFETALEYTGDKGKTMFYINPNATFRASVKRDENGMIRSLIFVQR